MKRMDEPTVFNPKDNNFDDSSESIAFKQFGLPLDKRYQLLTKKKPWYIENWLLIQRSRIQDLVNDAVLWLLCRNDATTLLSETEIDLIVLKMTLQVERIPSQDMFEARLFYGSEVIADKIVWQQTWTRSFRTR